MIFEPIAPYAAMMMCLKSARVGDASVEQAVRDLDARGKTLKPSDAAGWTILYREALALLPKVLAAHALQQAQRAAAQNMAARRQVLQTSGVQVQSALQRAVADWSGRFATQVQEIMATVQRSAEKLDVESHDDARSGETLYHYGESTLRDFETWLSDAQAKWRSNNQALVARRANEALEPARAQFGAIVSFEVTEPAFSAPQSHPLRLRGFSTQTLGKLDFLGTGYKTAMSAVMSGSLIASFLSRMSHSVGNILPYFFGSVFVASVVFACVTVPKKKRQAEFRLLQKAKKELQRELEAEVGKRLKQCADQQASEIKKHMDAEWLRWTELTRTSAGDSNPMAAMGGMSGLMPADVARLQGEWRLAIEARIAELEAGARASRAGAPA